MALWYWGEEVFGHVWRDLHCLCRSLPSVSAQGFSKILFDLCFNVFRKITEAVRKQMDTLGHVSNIYYHTKLHEYAERLTEKFSGDLKVRVVALCGDFFCNSNVNVHCKRCLFANFCKYWLKRSAGNFYAIFRLFISWIVGLKPTILLCCWRGAIRKILMLWRWGTATMVWATKRWLWQGLGSISIRFRMRQQSTM